MRRTLSQVLVTGAALAGMTMFAIPACRALSTQVKSSPIPSCASCTRGPALSSPISQAGISGGLQVLVDTSDFPARWHCGVWSATLGWTHIIADSMIWMAYTAIPMAMSYSLRRRQDTPFPAVQWLFVCFIVACGLTHLMEAAIFWWPAYRVSALIKVVTALLSWMTVASLLYIMPKILALRSPEQVEIELARRTEELTLHRAQLSDLNATLEQRVTERTRQLRTSEERFARAVDGTSDGLWDWDIKTGQVWYAHHFEELLGRAHDSLQPTFDTLRDLIHTDDRDIMLECLRHHLVAGVAFDVECRLLSKDGSYRWCRARGRAVRDERGQPLRMAGSIQDVSERKAIEHAQRLQITALNAAANPIFIAEMNGGITWVNSAFTRATGYKLEDVKEGGPSLLEAENSRGFYAGIRGKLIDGEARSGELVSRRNDGSTYIADVTVTPVSDAAGGFSHFVVITKDVTHERELESKLRQSQKLEAIGRLAAGIAHEINTPVQFAGDNLRFLQKTYDRLAPVVESCTSLLDELRTHSLLSGRVEQIEQLLKLAKARKFVPEIPGALTQSLEGIERVTNIVRALKEFSHPGQESKTPSDVNRIIESTVTVARNEWKYVAEMELDLSPGLPLVPCIVSDLSQTFLNIIINAAHAIEEVGRADPQRRGHIRIASWPEEGHVHVQISDDGTGIVPEHRDKLFDPFFTTKEVGKGTGQGLALAYSAIVERHGGTLEFYTEVGRGTSFAIRLPVCTDATRPDTWRSSG